MANYVYAVILNKYNSQEHFKTVHLVAQSLIQASHIAEFFIFEDNMFPNIPIEIVDIKKLVEIENLINADGLFDDEEDEVDLVAPLDLSHANVDNIAEFKCSCTNKVKVNMYDWPAIRCPHCNRIILHRDLSEVAGIWMYTPSNGSGK